PTKTIVWNSSSDQSPQSFSPSHFHHVGIQRPFLHSYWKYREHPGTSSSMPSHFHSRLTQTPLPHWKVNNNHNKNNQNTVNLMYQHGSYASKGLQSVK
uniref:Uncharacterized protein n=1 Tax=Neogobius melanostomus TaxID=47308 RepID=A0A8C6SHX8_9GOBI